MDAEKNIIEDLVARVKLIEDREKKRDAEFRQKVAEIIEQYSHSIPDWRTKFME